MGGAPMSLFVFVGEKSADLHGERLLKGLYARNPSLKVWGVGGPKMRAVGLDVVMEMERFQVMGFVDVFFALPRLIKQFYTLRREILKRNPKVCLFIDYPGFNLAMEKSLRKKGFKGQICHYICPSVWAWGKKRIPKMEKILDYLFVIFPFEKQFFNPEKLKCLFVGHPLVQRIAEEKPAPITLPQGRILALFPGSRAKEIDRNLSMQLKCAEKLMLEWPDLHIALSVTSSQLLPLIKKYIPPTLPVIFVEAKDTYALMRAAHMAIAKSGTVTLELALHGVPTVVTYGISPVDLFIARTILRINLPFYCIVNIVAQKEVFPELFGPYLTDARLLEATRRFLLYPQVFQECKENCRSLYNSLAGQSADCDLPAFLEGLLNERRSI